jgi:hypothetical protein
VYVNTAQEFDGSDAGARPDEAISWGKIKVGSNPVKVRVSEQCKHGPALARIEGWEGGLATGGLRGAGRSEREGGLSTGGGVGQ